MMNRNCIEYVEEYDEDSWSLNNNNNNNTVNFISNRTF